ncbi:nuclear envelope phosphatase-regulatory subunit 1 isoform X2 [Numida meleagris]|uniref:nuclear envelope phosphatase-regulatory subunit 1 isoform X2 n=1 Tax=Numida meleagris TaxID=8996 RepID=UPI000B3D9DA7|nr:nuclear envelope phosphatase-regulatory subunit 1 isoform X2 [Numida meleagris]
MSSPASTHEGSLMSLTPKPPATTTNAPAASSFTQSSTPPRRRPLKDPLTAKTTPLGSPGPMRTALAKEGVGSGRLPNKVRCCSGGVAGRRAGRGGPGLSVVADLKAFERRLTEYIACLQPATGRWRMILIVVSVCTATGAWNWLIDPETQKVSFFTSLWNHPFFTISCITLIGLFFAGIHKRVVAPSIIAARCRTVLAEYNMSCDDTGKLILKPRPHVQ